MAFDPLTAAFDLGKIAIEKLFPDKTKRAEEMRKLEELRQNGDLAKLNGHIQLMMAQSKINLADANSGNWWQSGWRPAVGWVGAASLALMYIPKAIVMTVIWTVQAFTIMQGWDGASALNVPAFPDLGASDVIGLLMAILGVAGMRSFEKTKGVDTK